MATIDLGKIKIVWRGTYAGGTAYTPDDAVVLNGTSYICIANTTGNTPPNATYWNVLAQAGTNGTDVGTTITTQGDILYRDGSGLQRLAAGTSGQFLKTLGSGANPAWATISSGSIKQVKINQGSGTQYSHNSQSYTDTGAAYQVTITPTASGNKIFIWTQVAPQMSNQGRGYYTFSKSGDSSGDGDLVGSNGIFNAENITQQGNGWVCGFYMDTANSTNALTYKLRQKTSNSTSLSTSVAQSHSIFMAIEIDQSKVS